MDSYVYPDSHLSEVGRRERNFMIQRLTKLAQSIKSEKEIRNENPSKAIPTLLQSVKYHTDMINSYADTRLRHIEKAVLHINEEYHRKLKLSMEALERTKANLKAEENYKSKALLRYEKEFTALSDSYKKTFGNVPINIVDINPIPFTQSSESFKIIDTNDTSDLVNLFSLTKSIPAPIPAFVPPQPNPNPPLAPPIPTPAPVVIPVPEPPAPVVEVKEVSSFFYTNDKENPFMTHEEVEMLKLRCEARGIPFPYTLSTTPPVRPQIPLTPLREKVNDTKSHLFHQPAVTKEVVTIPPPPKWSKPKIKPKFRPAEGLAGSQKYSIPLTSQDDENE